MNPISICFLLTVIITGCFREVQGVVYWAVQGLSWHKKNYFSFCKLGTDSSAKCCNANIIVRPPGHFRIHIFDSLTLAALYM